MKNFFTHELSLFLLSLFTQDGMWKGTKSSFYTAFTSVDIIEIEGISKFVVVDGGQLLDKVAWPKAPS